MLERSVKNLTSSSKPAMSLDAIMVPDLRMPMADDGCTKCNKCSIVCPEHAITVEKEWTIDIGKCIFCHDCMDSCPEGHLGSVYAPDYAVRREDLIFVAGTEPKNCEETVDPKKAKVIKGSASIRVLDAGSCNGCNIEADCMFNKYHDAERFGLKVVPSPRHADVLLVVGPITENMRDAALATYNAMAEPKIVVAAGTCAISGGPFRGGNIIGEGSKDTLPIDIFIPGCPPSPKKVITALLRSLGH